MSGRAQNVVASLEVLPPEIMLPIVMSLPGLDTLWNLMTASPNTWRLFNNYALTITEGIISGPNSILYEKIRELVRGVILVRAKTLPFKDLNEFQTQFLYAVFPFVKRKDAQPKTLRPEILSCSEVPAKVFRSVVATACQISALSQGCLASYLASFREIEPFSQPMSIGPSQNPSDSTIESDPIQVVDAGQPSWTEEMRALRAMWTIQLVGELKRLDKETWSKEDIDMLKQMNAADLVERPNSVVKAEEIRSAIDYLITLGDTTRDNYYRLQIPPLAKKRDRWITAERKTFRNAAPAVRLEPLLQQRAELLAGSMTVNDPVLSDDDRWGKVEPRLTCESAGVVSWRHLSSMHDSPVYGVKFDSFRRLGFAFWDKKRLHLAGLEEGIYRSSDPSGFHFFELESLLPADEAADIKAGIKAALRERGLTRIPFQCRTRDVTGVIVYPSLQPPLVPLSTRG